MNGTNTLLRLPSLTSLTQAPERTGLYLLAAAAHCNKNALAVEHPDLDQPIDDLSFDGQLPSTALLAARKLNSQIDAMLYALTFYEATLRDQVLTTPRDDMRDLPF